MIFRDRDVAAKLLLERLKIYKDDHPLILGIPRGAMPMAKIIADGLNGELNAVLVHKIPAPNSPEFAIGSVGLSGHIYRSSYVKGYGISERYITATAERELEILKNRKKMYGLPNSNIKNRVVIIVDDGIATGATTLCAIEEIRSQSPRKIIVATAVSSIEAAHTIERLVDELVVLDRPRNFFSVGQFFQNFPQVSDDEVISLFRGDEDHSLQENFV